MTHHIIQPTDPPGTREFQEAPIHCDGVIMGSLLVATWAGIIARWAWRWKPRHRPSALPIRPTRWEMPHGRN